MKLWSSFKKELILASRGFYFYVELGFAIVILLILLFAIPENFNTVSIRYLFIDLPGQGEDILKEELLSEDLDGKSEIVELEAGGEIYEAELFEKEHEKYYIVDSEEAVRELADSKRNLGAVIELDENNELYYRYYLQGYESTRLKNLTSIALNLDSEVLEQRFNDQEVVLLESGYEALSDRENTIPILLTFSGALLGMFVMTAYIFLDKKEGVIEAYAVTPSSVWRYLLSKIMVLLLTSVVSGLIIVMPVLGFTINYGLLILLLITIGFFASSTGLLIASFFDNMAKAFGIIYLLFFILMVPGIAYFVPGWDPFWIKFIPSYPMLQGFKEIILPEGDIIYPLVASAGFVAAGLVVFLLTNIRFKRTLSV